MTQHYTPTPEQRAERLRRYTIARMKGADHLARPPLRHHRYSLPEARHIKQVMPHGRFKPLIRRTIFE